MTLTNRNRLRARRAGRRRRAGFSIMEMLVVVILVGIIMSVATVRVSSVMVQQRVVRASSTIQTQLEQAFAMAGRNREPTKILFSTSASAIVLRVTNRDESIEFGRTNLKQLGLNNGDVTASATEVTVFPNGFASDTLSVQVSVTSNSVNYKRVVRMSRAGLVKVI